MKKLKTFLLTVALTITVLLSGCTYTPEQEMVPGSPYYPNLRMLLTIPADQLTFDVKEDGWEVPETVMLVNFETLVLEDLTTLVTVVAVADAEGERFGALICNDKTYGYYILGGDTDDTQYAIYDMTGQGNFTHRVNNTACEKCEQVMYPPDWVFEEEEESILEEV